MTTDPDLTDFVDSTPPGRQAGERGSSPVQPKRNRIGEGISAIGRAALRLSNFASDAVGGAIHGTAKAIGTMQNNALERRIIRDEAAQRARQAQDLHNTEMQARQLELQEKQLQLQAQAQEIQKDALTLQREKMVINMAAGGTSTPPTTPAPAPQAGNTAGNTAGTPPKAKISGESIWKWGKRGLTITAIAGTTAAIGLDRIGDYVETVTGKRIPFSKPTDTFLNGKKEKAAEEYDLIHTGELSGNPDIAPGSRPGCIKDASRFAYGETAKEINRLGLKGEDAKRASKTIFAREFQGAVFGADAQGTIIPKNWDGFSCASEWAKVQGITKPEDAFKLAGTEVGKMMAIPAEKAAFEFVQRVNRVAVNRLGLGE